MYVVLTLTTLGLGGLFTGRFDDTHIKKIYVSIVCAFMILFIALMRIDSGVDASMYRYIYNEMTRMPFLRAISCWRTDDYGFFALMWLVGKTGASFQWYLLVQAVISISCVGYYILKNSVNPMFSLLIFQSLYLYFYLSGFRQALALGFVLISYEADEGKFGVKAFLWFLLAFLFHQSALIALPYFIMRNWQYSRITCAICMACIVCTALFTEQLVSLINLVNKLLSRNQIFSAYDLIKPVNYIVILTLVSLVSLSMRGIMEQRSRDMGRLYTMMFLSLALAPLIYYNVGLQRVSYYYGIGTCILVPELTACFREKDRELAEYLAICALLLLFYRRLTPYYFFWQG